MSLTAGIDPDETIEVAVHRHPLSLVFPLFSALIVGMIGILIFYLLGRFPDQIQNIGPPSMVALAAVALLALAVILVIANLKIYLGNGLVLTDKTLYLVGQGSLISRRLSQFNLEKLEDVTATQNGLLSTLFNYGDITAKTSGEEKNMVFTWAPDPQNLSEVILDAHERAK